MAASPWPAPASVILRPVLGSGVNEVPAVRWKSQRSPEGGQHVFCPLGYHAHHKRVYKAGRKVDPPLTPGSQRLTAGAKVRVAGQLGSARDCWPLSQGQQSGHKRCRALSRVGHRPDVYQVAQYGRGDPVVVSRHTTPFHTCDPGQPNYTPASVCVVAA